LKGFNRSDAALKSLSPESFMPAIMTVQAFRNTSEREHLPGDVPILVILGIALIALASKKANDGRSLTARATDLLGMKSSADSECFAVQGYRVTATIRG
jgi:hypothetical protein